MPEKMPPKASKKNKDKLTLHSIYFMGKDGWNESSGAAWLKEHKYKVKAKGAHIMGDEIRFNQLPKSKFDPNSYVTTILPNGAHMVYGSRI